MQRARPVIAAALVIAAIATARAQPEPPDDAWREIAAMTEPAAAALARTELTGTVRAWGDPATGRFALVQDYTSTEPIADAARVFAELHDATRAALEADGAQLDAWRTDRGAADGAFRLGTFRALIRTRATLEPNGRLRARSAVCFFNDRERDRSERRCQRFIDTL